MSDVYSLISQKHLMLLTTQYFCPNCPSLIYLIAFLTALVIFLQIAVKLLNVVIYLQLNSGIIRLHIVYYYGEWFTYTFRRNSLGYQPHFPGISDIGLQDEFSHICNWAKANKMIINLGKTKGIVFRRPCNGVRSSHMPLPISNIEQVDIVNFWLFYFHATFILMPKCVRYLSYAVREFTC